MKSTLWSSGIHSKDVSGPMEHAQPGIVLQHAAFKSYALHKVYEFVERIPREINFVEFWQSTQKMRLDLRNTLDPELSSSTPRLRVMPFTRYTSLLRA